MTEEQAEAWIAERQVRGASLDEALAFFDTLPPVQLPELSGRWRGSGLPTGHPMDGLLEALRWYGKEFLDPDRVHPLLFEGRGGRLVTVDPRWLPLGLLRRSPKGPLIRLGFAAARPLLATAAPAARLRMMEHRGKVSATMIYDRLPIHDVFRRVGPGTVLGWMDLRGAPRPFFFVLKKI